MLNAAPTPPCRIAPHNIELEQALLGAILVNNEAFYRVSDFLEPRHFYEPIHQKVFETAASLVRVGKIASPVTLRTFLPPDIDVAGLTVGQYLARLAAEATTVINAVDYGQNIRELARLRDLIVLGEDMVNGAYEADTNVPVDDQIEQAERRLFELSAGSLRATSASASSVVVCSSCWQVDEAETAEAKAPDAGRRDTDKTNTCRLLHRLAEDRPISRPRRPTMCKARRALETAPAR